MNINGNRFSRQFARAAASAARTRSDIESAETGREEICELSLAETAYVAGGAIDTFLKLGDIKGE